MWRRLLLGWNNPSKSWCRIEADGGFVPGRGVRQLVEEKWMGRPRSRDVYAHCPSEVFRAIWEGCRGSTWVKFRRGDDRAGCFEDDVTYVGSFVGFSVAIRSAKDWKSELKRLDEFYKRAIIGSSKSQTPKFCLGFFLILCTWISLTCAVLILCYNPYKNLHFDWTSYLLITSRTFPYFHYRIYLGWWMYSIFHTSSFSWIILC